VRAFDNQAFAGGFTLGVVQAGWELAGKAEGPGGFGMRQCEANRRLLGDGWEGQVGEPKTWRPVDDVQLFFTNPPCSGFSVLSNAKFRGADSSINECMWNAAQFATTFNGGRGPDTFILESVGVAFKQGLGLMRGLRDLLEEWCGGQYHLTHVLQDNYSLGGCSKRRRYFMVCSREPFGVEPPTLTRLPVLGDAIGDLVSEPLQWDAQDYGAVPTWWSRQLRSPDGHFDGHYSPVTKASQRLLDLWDPDIGWAQGEDEDQVARRWHEQRGTMPDSWLEPRKDWDSRYAWAIDNGFKFGMFQRGRWRWDQPARVVTGAGPHIALHPIEPRFFTHREIARIMGFPDHWAVASLADYKPLEAGWGKGVSVHAGRWVAHWARESQLGNPGQYEQKLVSQVWRDALCPADADREHVVDVSQWWKTAIPYMHEAAYETALPVVEQQLNEIMEMSD
jgi:site-specific DNA-cytosine methylase